MPQTQLEKTPLKENKSLAINFNPESETFRQATIEYENIWKREGVAITQAIENNTKLKFADDSIMVTIYEGASYSGDENKLMKLRASYPPDLKKSTLIHELIHRLTPILKNKLNYSEHEIVDLVLYDIWSEIYGEEYAKKQARMESRIIKEKQNEDYGQIWKWALGMTKEQRQNKWKELLEANGI